MYRSTLKLALLLFSLAAASVVLVAQSDPALTSLSPTSGSVGTSITVSGNNFGATQGTSTVTFNGTNATPTSWNNSTIVVPVPSGATSGNVVVKVNSILSNGLYFDVAWTPPSISSLSPNTGMVGASITINGSNFGPSQGSSTVTFNGTAATPTSWSATSITLPVPTGATTGTVVVTVNGAASNAVQFTVVGPTPSITSITPTGASVGTSVTIAGTNFGSTQGSSTVTFNGTSASPASWSNASIVAPVPTGATSGNVVVTVGGQASSGFSFTVLPAAAPFISSLSANSGTTGTSIAISGSNFGATQGTSTITFNGTAATPSAWSNTSISVPVPAAATTGPVVVKVSGTNSNPVTFVVVPSISNITPASGSTTATVEVNGTGFGSTQGTSTLTFNGTPASPSVWSDTQLIATLPTGATTGPVVVTVGGRASNGVTFTLLYSAGLSGSIVNASGGAAISGATVNAYSNGALAGSATSSTNGSYSLSALASGTYSVVISASGFASQTITGVALNPGQTATLNVSLSTPSISAVSPNSGSSGSAVTVTGSYFGSAQGNSTVTFNGTPASVQSWSNASISATVPTGATTGPVVVTVGGAPSNGVTFTVGNGVLSGTVTAASGGSAISGATVQALQGGAVKASTTSSGTGAYSFSSLPPGTYDVMASASGYGDLISTGVSVTAGNTTTQNFALPVAGTISGTVTQSGGPTPIVGATARAYQGQDTVASATSDSNGNYTISGLGPGTYSVTASASGYSPQTTNNVSVTSGNTTQENFSLSNQPVITYAYDADGRLVGVANSLSTAANYNYDAVGNILSISQHASSQISITEFLPAQGPVGTTVTIYGTGFSTTASQNTVTFNGTTATVTSSTSTQIVTTVPTGATTGTINVTAPSGSATSTASFTVSSSNGLPSISSFTPTIVTPGTAVTVTGTNFNPTPSNDFVAFNGTYGSVTAAQATSVTAAVPTGGTSGHVTVATVVGSATSSGDLFVAPPPFTAANLVSTGRMTLGGTSTVTINAANNIGLVLFDGVAGQKASFLLNNSTFTGCNAFSASVIAPGGQTLVSGNACNTTSLYLEPTHVLPVTGTYTVMVEGFSSGSVTVNAYAPVDVMTSISIGGAAVNLSTSTPGQNAQLTFTGTIGQKVSLYLKTITYTGCNGNTLVATILNPDRSVLSTAGECNGTTLFIDSAYLPLSGTYTILIDPQGASTGGLTANLYNAADSTTLITAGGSPVTVTITQPGQNGTLTFSGTAGEKVSLVMTGVTIPSSNVYIANTTTPPPAGQQYNIEMDYYQANSASVAQLWYYSNSTPMQIIPSSQLYTPGGTVGGLQGDYFTDTTLEGYPQVRRTDPTVNFNWTNTSPDPSIPTTNFGVRWTGSVQVPTGESYTFCTVTDDGVRLYINNSLVINHWINQNATQYCSNYLASAVIGTGGGYIDTITLPSNGTYNILLNPQSNNTGSMTFTLYAVPADVSGTITPGGAPVTVTTTTPGQNASLTFTATAGQKLSLLMSGVTINSSTVTVQNTATLTAGQTYPIKMQYFQAGAGAMAQLRWYSPSTVKQIIPQTQLYPPNSPNPGGLQGAYFANQLLEGAAMVTRIDPTINFNWNTMGPDPAIPQTYFSAVWNGNVQPQYSENYTFCTTTDDGTRLYLNGSLIVNDWSTQAPTEFCSNNLGSVSVGTGGAFIDTFIAPVDGTYTIVVDPQSNYTGSMTLTLYAVPDDYSGTIVAGGSPVVVSTTTPGQNAQLTFNGTAGQRVSLLMNNVTISSSTVSVKNTAPFAAGQQYTVKMEYFQGGGGSTAQLWFYSPSTVKQVIPTSLLYPQGSGSPGGLQGNYFTNANLAGTPTVVRTDPNVNFNWNGTAPDPSIPGTNFSARWLGSVQTPNAENYTFCTTTDDGTRLWINNSLVVNDWTGQGPTEYCSGTWGQTNVGTSGGFIDTITLPVDGTYTIPIDPQGSPTGSIQATLYNVPPDVTGTLTINGAAQTVTIGTPGQNASYTFSGTAGQLLTVHVTNNSINRVTVSLQNPDGTTATSVNSPSASFNLLQQTLGTTGTYTVFIDPSGSATGSLSVSVTSP